MWRDALHQVDEPTLRRPRPHHQRLPGCSSIYGGNLPTTPYAQNHEGRGPAWTNSLFEDNAEFGLGLRLAVDKQTEYARELLTRLSPSLGDELVLLNAGQPTRTTESGIR